MSVHEFFCGQKIMILKNNAIRCCQVVEFLEEDRKKTIFAEKMES